jgi:hypothetical protein
MKKNMLLLSVIATALVVGACGNDELTDSPVRTSHSGEETTDGDVRFGAIIASNLFVEPEEGESAGSNVRRVAYNTATGKISQWFDNDQISISDGVLSYTYQASATEGSGCSFTSITSNSFTTEEAEAEENEFDAFYPAAAVLGWNNGTVTTMIYTDQDYTENVEGSGVMGPYMAAHTTTTDGGRNAHFEFMNIASVIDVNIADLGLAGKVKSVSVYANNQVSIAGKMQYNTGSNRITVPTSDATGYSYSTQSETVTVSEINKTAAEAGVVRFFVLPIKIVGGVTITIRMEDGSYYSKHTTNNVGNSTETDLSQTGVSGGTIVRPYYKKYNFGAYNQEGITQNDWMGTIPGNIRFSMLSIPGTHDAATSSTSSAARTQSLTIAQQLEAGVRALDLRPGFTSSSLEIYHGLVSTGVTLSAALDATRSFLENHPTETVFVLIHEEDNSFFTDPHSTEWSNRVWACLNNYKDIIASAGWKSALNACRGKMVVIFRDSYTDGTNNGDLGCGKVGWGSDWNEKSIMNGSGSTVNSGYSLWYQDIYDNTNYQDKESYLVRMLTEFIQKYPTTWERLYVNNVNMTGSSLSDIAKEMNQRVVNNAAFSSWNGRFCLMFADFVCNSDYHGNDIYHFIRNQNYKYVYTKRTRHTTASGTDTGMPVSGDEVADDGEVYVKQR